MKEELHRPHQFLRTLRVEAVRGPMDAEAKPHEELPIASIDQ